jgi:RNA polymerase sigma-32 factor
MTINYATALEAPMLELEQERFLIQRWQQNRDSNALQELIVSHARQVHAYLRRFRIGKEHREDLFAEGLLGLIQAAERFDLKRNVRFSTYAQWWIANSVKMAANKLRQVVDIPAGHRNGSEFINTAGSLETIEGELEETLRCEAPTPEERAIKDSDNRRLRAHVLDALADLEATEREVVVARNLTAAPEPVDQLASRLDISRDRLRQVERRALSRMKYALMSRGVTTAVVGS